MVGELYLNKAVIKKEDTKGNQDILRWRKTKKIYLAADVPLKEAF